MRHLALLTANRKIFYDRIMAFDKEMRKGERRRESGKRKREGVEEKKEGMERRERVKGGKKRRGKGGIYKALRMTTSN